MPGRHRSARAAPAVPRPLPGQPSPQAPLDRPATGRARTATFCVRSCHAAFRRYGTRQPLSDPPGRAAARHYRGTPCAQPLGSCLPYTANEDAASSTTGMSGYSELCGAQHIQITCNLRDFRTTTDRAPGVKLRSAETRRHDARRLCWLSSCEYSASPAVGQPRDLGVQVRRGSRSPRTTEGTRKSCLRAIPARPR